MCVRKGITLTFMWVCLSVCPSVCLSVCQHQAKLELKKQRRDFEQISKLVTRCEAGRDLMVSKSARLAHVLCCTLLAESHLESLKALQEQRAARRQYRYGGCIRLVHPPMWSWPPSWLI